MSKKEICQLLENRKKVVEEAIEGAYEQIRTNNIMKIDSLTAHCKDYLNALDDWRIFYTKVSSPCLIIKGREGRNLKDDIPLMDLKAIIDYSTKNIKIKFLIDESSNHYMITNALDYYNLELGKISLSYYKNSDLIDKKLFYLENEINSKDIDYIRALYVYAQKLIIQNGKSGSEIEKILQGERDDVR